MKCSALILKNPRRHKIEKKLCLITGANSGIGKAASIQVARNGHHVILACRNQSRGEAVLREIKSISKNHSVELMIVDMSLQSSIRAFVTEFLSKYDTLDVIIHNAADFNVTRKHIEFTEENIERIWATNYLGPVFMTELLPEAIKRSKQGRIITVSSKGLIGLPSQKVDFQDPEFRKRKFSVAKAYYQSKLALEMYTWWLAKRLGKTPITVNCIRVTNVKIDIEKRYPNTSKIDKFLYSIKSKFSITPEEMAKTYSYLAISDEVRNITGKCFEYPNKIKDPSGLIPKFGMNKEKIKLLMDCSSKYLPIMKHVYENH